MKQVIYLSGPITGAGPLWSAPFMEAERYFTEQGWEVVNPATIDPADADYDGVSVGDISVLRNFLHRDFKYLACSDAIALLPGWRNSKGANAELAVARMMGLSVHYYSTTMESAHRWPLAMPTRETLELVIGGTLE